MYYNKQGKEIDTKTWANLFEDNDYKIIKQDKLDNGKFVSTVWLGLDHSFESDIKLIFETMVFHPDEIDVERYSTLEDAVKGHKKMVIKHNK